MRMRTIRTQVLRNAVTLLFLTTVIGGCGSGGSGTAPTGTAPAGTALTGSDDPGNVPSPANSTYDTRVGLGADANGIPILTKDASARYIYWNPSHGSASDSNAGTDPNYPKATLVSAWAALRTGSGDWLLMAQGATTSSGFGQVPARSGRNASYPVVVTTYNPAAPTDTAQMRQGKVTVNVAVGSNPLSFYNYTGQYVVFENIDLVQPLTTSAAASSVMLLNWEYSSDTTPALLFHNVRFLRTQVTVQGTTGTAHLNNIVFRHCVFAYASQPSSRGHSQGMYMWATNGVTIEDSIFYHNGWSDNTGSRNTASNAPDIFNHNAYFGTLTYNTIFRRNITGHASSHGLQLRGGGIANDNVFISNPINLLIGGGDNYSTYRPAGVTYSANNNVIIGSEDITSSTPRGFGVLFENTQDGGSFDNNLVVNVGAASTGGIHAFIPTWMASQFNLPTYINITNSIMWRWNSNYSTNSFTSPYRLADDLVYSGTSSQMHFSYSGNVLQHDTSPTGTNRNTPATAFPDPTRDIAGYATANGHASESALWAAMIANPKAGWASSIGNYIRAGYGK